MKLNWKRIAMVFIPILIIIGVAVYFLFFNKNKELDSDGGKDGTKNPPVEEKKLKILDEKSDTRPIATMINNHKEAQPYQTGLNDAYIVYEIVTEGGITRMLAVFKDKSTTQIGTIRSSRHYFLDYALENDAVYVHFGWSPQAEKDISSLKINNINGLYDGCFWRDKTLKVDTEHTVYTSMEKLKATIADKKYRTTSSQDTLLNYSIDTINLSSIEGATKADNVKIVYSTYQTNNWKYDATNKVYTKYSGDTMRKDYITGKPFTAKNIITYKVKNYNLDSYGRQTLDNVGNGTGYYISEGYAVPIKWEKKSRSSQTVYTYLDGKEINVNDGNTYIQIQPTSQTLEITTNE